MRLQNYKLTNEQLSCRIYECTEVREGLSRFCSNHANHMGNHGSPTFKPVDHMLQLNGQATLLFQQIKDQVLPEPVRRKLANLMSDLPRDREYLYRNREIESGLKVLEKSRIIRVTALHNTSAERIVADSILWAIACELDTPYHSNRTEQKGFYRNSLGNDISNLAAIGRRWYETVKQFQTDSWHDAGQPPVRRVVSEERVLIIKKQSIRGAVKRKVGAFLLASVEKELGQTRIWMKEDWATPYVEHLKTRFATVPFAEREFALS
jgi:hypothetical protein